MAQKTDAQVTIGGRTYTLSGYESEEYLQEIAAYLNSKIEQMQADRDYQKIPLEMRNVLLQLNISDDCHKARREAERLAALAQERMQEIADLKHEIVALQMKMEAMQK
jgi:cell division protein ZapA